MSIKIITPPASEPVLLADAVLHCRIDGTDEIALGTALSVAAREYCEKYSGRAYITQTIRASFDGWPRFPINLPRPPLASVSSVKYYGEDNTEYTLDAANYYVDTDAEPGRIALAAGISLPATTLRDINAVQVTYTAGYGAAAAAVPQRVKQAMLLLIGYWYQNREAAAIGKVSSEISFAVQSLLGLDRVWPV